MNFSIGQVSYETMLDLAYTCSLKREQNNRDDFEDFAIQADFKFSAE